MQIITELTNIFLNRETPMRTMGRLFAGVPTVARFLFGKHLGIAYVFPR